MTSSIKICSDVNLTGDESLVVLKNPIINAIKKFHDVSTSLKNIWFLS